MAQNTLKAEYTSVSYAFRECISIRRLYKELLPHTIGGPIVIYCDNHGAFLLAKNEVINELTLVNRD